MSNAKEYVQVKMHKVKTIFSQSDFLFINDDYAIYYAAACAPPCESHGGLLVIGQGCEVAMTRVVGDVDWNPIRRLSSARFISSFQFKKINH